MRTLKCKALCTEGGCKQDCEIRECVINKKYEGCWECSDFKNCVLLEPLQMYHPLEDNPAMIKKYGTERWMEHRGKHYRWL